ncbi:conserved protein of unknown function [Georgfuchsia toluolica]|uniref:Pyridoxamine 5'-phosphate oxidase N-terminal domain-containing protein n=1 Tax=Georgfuchsia toluolica TaxID=424218 RepID=A0A916MYX3_9PROT|nr:pyridoxamine 5'-phosphate oxidase family protein [Georgfuchsia toluolica]CAG4882319.1 conserved protein of unknown function [Georgfuchsia toluolica]
MSVRGQLLEYLSTHNVMTLATIGEDGPWASAVFYVHEGTTLFFLSSPTTRHCRNIQYHPRVAATVQEDYSQWDMIKGIQIEGVASRLNAEESRRIADIYIRKFTFLKSLKIPMELGAAMQKVAWYSLTPDFLYWIDNSRGLGNRERIDADDTHNSQTDTRHDAGSK